MPNNKEAGIMAENYVMSLLNKKGIPYMYVDDWYDLELMNGHKLEIKSCQISIRDHKEHLRIGRFDFTDKENRERQCKENIWVCFVLRHHEEFILIGFVRAKDLKQERYINLHTIRDYNPFSFDGWINLVNRKKKNGN